MQSQKGMFLLILQKVRIGLLRVLNKWMCSRSITDDGECPSDLLEAGDPEKLNFWLPRYINEVRREDGNPYPPRSIHQILVGVQPYMLDNNHCLPKFLDRNNLVFRQIHGACDSISQSSLQWGWNKYLSHSSH